MKQRIGAHFTAADIDDGAIFDFWTEPPGDSGDYHLYSRVMRIFPGLRGLSEVGQRRLEMEHAGPWFGEWWVPGDLAPAPNAPRLLGLCGPERSARLKFLIKREADLSGVNIIGHAQRFGSDVIILGACCRFWADASSP